MNNKNADVICNIYKRNVYDNNLTKVGRGIIEP